MKIDTMQIYYAAKELMRTAGSLHDDVSQLELVQLVDEAQHFVALIRRQAYNAKRRERRAQLRREMA